MTRRALVTGGCGFIGSNLGRLLVAEGWEVVAYDDLSTGSEADAERAGYADVVVGEVRDSEALTAAAVGADAVVHLAAHTNVVESVDDPRNDVEVNVLGTLNALIAAREGGARAFVFASSNAPLGSVPPPTHEELVPRPLSPYGASKLAGEALCSAFAGSYELKTTALRFSNVYGPYSYHKGSVVARYLKDVAEGRPLTIFGDGSQTRDFVYVDDLCRGIGAALDRRGAGGEVFHLGTGTETAIIDLANMIRALAGADVEIVFEPPRAGEIQRNYSSIAKARAALQFDPKVGLRDGLATTYDWFRSAYP